MFIQALLTIIKIWQQPKCPFKDEQIKCGTGVHTQWNIMQPLHVCVLSHFSRVRLFATLWTVACQAPLSMGLSRQEYWSGSPCPPPGGLPNLGIKPTSLKSPALQADSLLLSHRGSPMQPSKGRKSWHVLQHEWNLRILGKISQSQRDKYCMLPLTWST